MTKQEEIAAFIDRHITLRRARGVDPRWLSTPARRHGQPERPTAEQLGNELLAIAEFRALQLGGWLGTTDGQVIAEAVEMVSPPLYAEDVDLLVQALIYASQLQQRESQTVAGKVALGAIAVAAVLAICIAASGPRAPDR